MQAKEYKNDFFDRVEARGKAWGKAEVLVKILDSRTIDLTSEQHDQVMSCADPSQLDRWIDRALAATSVEDVFQD
jgi:hypothetical protein